MGVGFICLQFWNMEMRSSASSAAKHFAELSDSKAEHLYHNNGDGTFTNQTKALG